MTHADPWTLVRIHPHGRLHFTEDGQQTHCRLRLREGSATVTVKKPEAEPHCHRCLRWYRIYDEMLREKQGDIEAARKGMRYVGCR